jgi:hypothetical protein
MYFKTAIFSFKAPTGNILYGLKNPLKSLLCYEILVGLLLQLRRGGHYKN